MKSPEVKPISLKRKISEKITINSNNDSKNNNNIKKVNENNTNKEKISNIKNKPIKMKRNATASVLVVRNRTESSAKKNKV